MKAFTFRLETLLQLREMSKDKAMKNYALAISNRENAEVELRNAVKSLEILNQDIVIKRTSGFSGHEQENFNQSINRKKGEIIDFNSKLADSKNIESAKRKIYLEADSNCKSLLKLKNKKRSEHLKTEEKKEETELEDIIGARFVFNNTSY
ncbi:MAG: flagellar export protein FliJ [Opitutales bacterium]|nr:flagellar export protein FliJ [Opitutales bacterium]MDG1324915.1 flagellar export protein FliJ [Opitutales bacterium]